MDDFQDVGKVTIIDGEIFINLDGFETSVMKVFFEQMQTIFTEMCTQFTKTTIENYKSFVANKLAERVVTSKEEE